MLISYHWLKKFVNLKQSPQEIADKITLNLVEVESITKRGDDWILEIENKGITNRPDCFSQLGIAREIAAYFDLKLKNPLLPLKKTRYRKPTKKYPLDVQIREPKLCYRYSSIVLADIKVQPSPKWLRVGVENCGIRSINNVVDITNYVMLELGQPLHAFDYQKVKNQQIIVRRAKKGERIKTFEGNIIKLLPSTLIIADAEKPVGIAGIIGGKGAEINSQTKSIILESANFNKINNRKTEKDLKIRTEASTRFEKGLDINLTLPALHRAAELLQKVSGAKIASGLIDIQSKKNKPKKIKTKVGWINRFLGLNLRAQEMASILKRLQLQLDLEKNSLIVTIPTYRSDLNLPADIAEEIARIYGYDNLPITLPETPSFSPQENPEIKLRKKVKQFLQAAGCSEILTQPFVGKKHLETFNLNPENHLRLLNPLTSEQEYMRRTIIPQLALVVKENLKNFDQVKLFEIDKIFIPQPKKKLPQEIYNLAMAAAGKNSYLVLKGVMESLFKFQGIDVSFGPEKKTNFWQEGQIATIFTAKGEKLGNIGKIKKNISLDLEIHLEASFTEINFSRLTQLSRPTKIYQPLFQYPPIIEDLSFIVPPKTLMGEMIEETRKVSRLIQSIELIDSYKNTRTFRITYQSLKRTLTDREVEKVRKKIIKGLGKRFKAQLKGR